MKICTVVGARPQFVKAAPLSRALRERNTEILIHTGQHYDHAMSDVFFEELGIPTPEHHLGIGGGSHGAQTGAMLAKIEDVLLAERPDAVLVYGDTNSTLAGALAAVKLHIPVAHVEAGLRSYDRRMPEEVNRVLADSISEWLFVPSEGSVENLRKEGVTKGVVVVGDVMIDALRINTPRALVTSKVRATLGLDGAPYYLATIHRPSNSDVRENLVSIFDAFKAIEKKVVFPVHPRTRANLARMNVQAPTNVQLVEPLGYLDMLAAVKGASGVMTDSGGLQKEAYYLQVPCITLRETTEWVETVDSGWNVLTGPDTAAIVAAVRKFETRPASHPELFGDGHAAERIVSHLEKCLSAGISNFGPIRRTS